MIIFLSGYLVIDRRDLLAGPFANDIFDTPFTEDVNGIGWDSDFDNDFLDARVGFDAAVTESFHVLFSMATGLHEPNGEDKLDYDVFLGFQFLR